MLNVKDKKVAVLGFGVEGLSSVRWLKKHRALPTVLDQKAQSDFPKDVRAELVRLGVQGHFGEDYLADTSLYDIILRSPGIRPDISFLEQAKKKGTAILSQTALFFNLCPAPIVGVTGTKGKGTTATLITNILKAADYKVFLGGNIGQPPLDFLDQVKQEDRVVLELSSFQLMDLAKSPHVGVVLMVTLEHLDWHKNIAEYLQAKEAIVRYQQPGDYAVIAANYPASCTYAQKTQGHVLYFSRASTVKKGTWVKEGAFWYADGNMSERIMGTDEVRLTGQHNWDNIAAAITATKVLGAPNASIRRAVRAFSGLEHRLEKVKEVAGVTYYNDSFSTTPETAIAAIKAFTMPEILILGGSKKESDFRELGAVISQAKNIKAIIGIGEEWPRIKLEIKEGLNIIEDCRNMEEIVRTAAGIAEEGDVVLLSPACASFDMFKNYKDRGVQFKEVVRSL